MHVHTESSVLVSSIYLSVAMGFSPEILESRVDQCTVRCYIHCTVRIYAIEDGKNK